MTTRPTTEIDRAKDGYWNSDPVSPTNPGGMDESADGTIAGHVDNFPAAVQAVGLMTQWAGEQAGEAGAARDDAVIARNAAQAAATAAAAHATDALFCSVGGTATALVLTSGLSLAALTNGLTVRFVAIAAFTGAVTTLKIDTAPATTLHFKNAAPPPLLVAVGDLVTATYSAAGAKFIISGVAAPTGMSAVVAQLIF